MQNQQSKLKRHPAEIKIYDKTVKMPQKYDQKQHIENSFKETS